MTDNTKLDKYIMLNGYYESYWKKRKKNAIFPIRPGIPFFLRKYSSYGAILDNILPGKTLDMGCGDGNVSKLYLSKSAVYGIDISKSALKYAKNNGIKAKYCDLNNNKIPFPSGFFDNVIMTDVIEHLIDPLGLLIEAKRVLKKGGKLIITVPNFARLNNRLRMIKGDPTDLLHWEKFGDELEHLHWFTKPKLQYIAGKIGLKVDRFVPTGLPFSFIFGLLGLPGLGRNLTVVLVK